MTRDAKLTIVDALLTLILRIWLGACRRCFSQWRLRISDEWISPTNRNINYARSEAQSPWCSIDAHSQDAAGSISLSRLAIGAANISLMHHSDQIVVQLPYSRNHKSLTPCWPSFYCIVHSTLAAIDNSFHYDLNMLVVFPADWDLALWQSRAQLHSCTVRPHTTKIYVSYQIVHCACHSSVYQPILTSYCSPFAHNISLTNTLVQDTYRSWWNIDAFCPTFFSLPYSSSFQLHWLSSTTFQPVRLTSVSAESIQEHSARRSHPAALAILDPQCFCLALCQIHPLLRNRLRCH